ncbi:type II toxin-antitoxin system YafO family toxin [Duganella sp. Root336D2]|uniref:type II toxin-antitoxin system YafO family toxin n=1 Tax=Duganella sp. Root336D2 TaxID=1736518 RepID=UPI0006FE2C01|nr:type II toxin-antitoxin system YafO family toxin [Duganella sp. Root336D2]KQV51333.1 hypothetical protein ASD07_10590 [Duganella sp. Root336D2]
MSVKITTVLRQSLEAQGLDADKLLVDFAEWKAGDEYDHFFFGKDAPYTTPVVDNEKNVLMHVHLVPLKDYDQLANWKKKFRHRSRKTSDRVLVYVSDKRKGHLLIYILDEPDAHEIARMKTAEHRELMEGFAVVASEFLDTGEVLN